jgi:hypothetical protein
MRTALSQTLSSRWLAGAVHAGLWVLVYLSASGLGGKTPIFREADGTLPPPPSPAPVARLDPLLARGVWPNLAPRTNALNAFYTRHFTPPPKPAPPPPTTRMIELTYLGYYETEGTTKTVMARLADAFLVAPVGTRLTANLFAADAGMESLTLTNAAAQTNLIKLNTKKQLEVPIQ